MPHPTSAPPPYDDLRHAIEESLARRDRAAAVRTALDAVRGGAISVPELYVSVLSPLLASIGSAWAHGTERVWEEHLASHTIRTIVESLYLDVQRDVAAVPRRNESAVLACPPRELHELGLRMLSDRFELAGWDVTFLGADTPLEELVAATNATGATLVALSVSTIFERVELRRFIDSLRAQLPGVRIVVGGPAFAHDEQWPDEDFLDTRTLGLPGEPAEG